MLAAMQIDLATLQTGLKQALVSRAALDTHNAIADEIVEGTLSAQRRIAIYRHNVFTNLVNTLSDLYPVVKRIVGDVFFTEAAHSFITQIPSRAGDLNQFGDEFGRFLRGYTHAVELPYLADVATLEWQWHTAFHAADATPLDLARLATIPPDQMDQLIFKLHPAVTFFSSPYPLLKIWQVNQPDYADDWQIDWNVPAGHFVVYRREFDVLIQQLNAGEYTFLMSVAANLPLEQAWQAAVAQDPEFNLQGFIGDCVHSHIINNFEPPI